MKTSPIFLGIIILLILPSIFLFSSCKKNLLESEISTKGLKAANEISLKSKLKKNFSKILVKALASRPDFRSLLKLEAMEKFDRDYDVLYEKIKYVKLSNGETVRSLLLSFCNNENELIIIEQELPLLTIFIPSLPNQSFSAENWNTDTDILQVGSLISESNDVPIYKSNGEEYVLKSNLIPAFPVVVVKECERIIPANSSYASKVSGGTLEFNNKKFKFLDDTFNNSTTGAQSARTVKGVYVSQKLKDAYEIYLNADGWQRDYVYYGITPTIPNGQFSYDYKETITEFSLNGDPMAAYNKIADQTGDPQINTIVTNVNSGWTGGAFEFKVSVLFNAKNGLGTTYETYFPAIPTDLFDLTYTYMGVGLYQLQSVSLKKMYPYLQLFKWDLNQYASTIKLTSKKSIYQRQLLNPKPILQNLLLILQLIRLQGF